jgi:hypothetical protein
MTSGRMSLVRMRGALLPNLRFECADACALDDLPLVVGLARRL